jgi:hypothetical protein
MKKVGMIRRAGAAFLMLLFLVGFCYAADMNPGKYVLRNTHDFQQDVSGEGFVMVYQDVNTNNLSLKNYLHGSGIMDMATIINSEQKKSRTPETVNSLGYSASPWGTAYDSVITFTEQNQMSYAPVSFDMVTGWYATHPLQYKSALKEKTDSRNFQAGISMEHQIEYARAFKKDIGVTLNCTAPIVASSDSGDGVGLNNMRIEEEVTHGSVHISEKLIKPGVQVTTTDKKDNSYAKGSNREALILIDENYIGSFKIKKNMKINAPKPYVSDSSDWLPCCMGGFFDMASWDQKIHKSQAGIFDCTCRETALKTYKPEWNQTKAQFPTDVYKSKA